jgi:hypothetical protein
MVRDGQPVAGYRFDPDQHGGLPETPGIGFELHNDAHQAFGSLTG